MSPPRPRQEASEAGGWPGGPAPDTTTPGPRRPSPRRIRRRRATPEQTRESATFAAHGPRHPRAASAARAPGAAVSPPRGCALGTRPRAQAARTPRRGHSSFSQQVLAAAAEGSEEGGRQPGARAAKGGLTFTGRGRGARPGPHTDPRARLRPHGRGPRCGHCHSPALTTRAAAPSRGPAVPSRSALSAGPAPPGRGTDPARGPGAEAVGDPSGDRRDRARGEQAAGPDGPERSQRASRGVPGTRGPGRRGLFCSAAVAEGGQRSARRGDPRTLARSARGEGREERDADPRAGWPREDSPPFPAAQITRVLRARAAQERGEQQGQRQERRPGQRRRGRGPWPRPPRAPPGLPRRAPHALDPARSPSKPSTRAAGLRGRAGHVARLPRPRRGRPPIAAAGAAGASGAARSPAPAAAA